MTPAGLRDPATKAPAAGIRWRDYDCFMQKFVKRIGDERLKKVPTDLDLKPYRDEHDLDLLKRMQTAIDRGRTPKGVDAVKIKQALARHAPEIKRHLDEMVSKRR